MGLQHLLRLPLDDVCKGPNGVSFKDTEHLWGSNRHTCLRSCILGATNACYVDPLTGMFGNISPFILFFWESKNNSFSNLSLFHLSVHLEISEWFASNKRSEVFFPDSGCCGEVHNLPPNVLWLSPSLLPYLTQSNNISEQSLFARPWARKLQRALPPPPPHVCSFASSWWHYPYRARRKSLPWPHPKLQPIGKQDGGMSSLWPALRLDLPSTHFLRVCYEPDPRLNPEDEEG